MAAKVSSDVVISESLDYKPSTYEHGKQVYTRIFQQVGGSSVTITPAATTECLFELPQKCFILSDSYLEGLATPTAAGGGAFNWTHETSNFISEIHLMTRGGQLLCSLANAANYLHIIQGWYKSFDEFVSSDPVERFYPSRKDGSAGEDGPPLVTNLGNRLTAAGTGVTDGIPYTEPMHFVQSLATGDATPLVRFQIRLGVFKDTILAMNKALLFPEVLILRVVMGPGRKFQWKSTTTRQPYAGTTDPTGNITVTNFSLMLSLETNIGIISGLTAKLSSSGYKLPIPYVSMNRILSPASTSLGLTVKIGPEYGWSLKRIIYAPFGYATTETKHLAFDNMNAGGAKIASYTTTLDSMPLQPYTIDCSTLSDYALHKPFLKGTAVQNSELYQYNWFHCDDFSGLTLESESKLPVPKDNIVAGIPIVGPHGSERIWGISGTQANAVFANYVFIVSYRTLMVTPSGIMVTSAA